MPRLNPDHITAALWLGAVALAIHAITLKYFIPELHVPLVLLAVFVLKFLNAQDRRETPATLPVTRGLHRSIPGSWSREEL